MVTRKAPVTKEDLTAFKKEILHQFRIIAEDLRSNVKQVAEGVTSGKESLDRGLQDLTREVQETRQEVLGAVKISYAELDRRLTTLEQAFLGVCRPTSNNRPEEKCSFTRCARINDHGAVKGSNTPGKVFLPGIPTDSLN
jgi:hypothetical protein